MGSSREARTGASAATSEEHSRTDREKDGAPDSGAPSRLSVQQVGSYRPRRRRIIGTRPTSPVPRSATDVGSGVVLGTDSIVLE